MSKCLNARYCLTKGRITYIIFSTRAHQYCFLFSIVSVLQHCLSLRPTHLWCSFLCFHSFFFLCFNMNIFCYLSCSSLILCFAVSNLLWILSSELFFNNFTKVDYTYDNKLHLFKVYKLMSFDICIHLWNHHHNQDSDHSHHPRKFFGPP